MSLASASEPRAGEAGGFRLSLAAIVVLVAVSAAASVFLKAMLMEQPAGSRTALLALIAGLGACIACLPVALLAHLFARNWRPLLRGLMAGLWMLLAFVPATLFAFAVENRIIEGRIEADSVRDLGASELFWTLFGAMGLFTPTGLAYLLPWPVLTVALVAFLCFHRWRAV